MPPPDGDAAGAARGARGGACFLLFLEEASFALLFVFRFLPMIPGCARRAVAPRSDASQQQVALKLSTQAGTHPRWPRLAQLLCCYQTTVWRGVCLFFDTSGCVYTALFFSLLVHVRALVSQHGDCAFAVCRSLPGHADTLARPSYPLLPQRSQWYPRFARTPPRQAAQQAAGRKALKNTAAAVCTKAPRTAATEESSYKQRWPPSRRPRPRKTRRSPPCSTSRR